MTKEDFSQLIDTKLTRARRYLSDNADSLSQNFTYWNGYIDALESLHTQLWKDK